MTPSFKINISSAPLEQRDPDLSTAFNDREIAVAENIRHLCVPLGPYRNLTNITAAIFATHKRALVLNHAAIRVLSDESLDVFKNPAEDTFLHFKRIAVRLSRGGQRGDYGGDIRLSHAFESDELVNLYLRYHKSGVLNENATALFWKDSMRILNHMTANGLRPGDLARDHRFFRFLVPIRSPLDC